MKLKRGTSRAKTVFMLLKSNGTSSRIFGDRKKIRALNGTTDRLDFPTIFSLIKTVKTSNFNLFVCLRIYPFMP